MKHVEVFKHAVLCSLFCCEGRNILVVVNLTVCHILYQNLCLNIAAIHENFGEDVSNSLDEHNPQNCVVCTPDVASEDSETFQPNRSSSDLFGKIRYCILF